MLFSVFDVKNIPKYEKPGNDYTHSYIFNNQFERIRKTDNNIFILFSPPLHGEYISIF
jgi:hypothetical protein